MNNRHLATKDFRSFHWLTRIRRIRQNNLINKLLSQRVLKYLVMKKIVYKPR
jgi:hypothetical protein